MHRTAAYTVAGLAVIGTWVLIRVGPARTDLVLGGVVTLVSLALLLVARAQLGSAFAVTPRATTLVTKGLYARLLHPMYLFLDLTLLGVILAFRQALLLLPWVGLVVVQSWQAAREERVLERAFGESYRRYRARTWC